MCDFLGDFGLGASVLIEKVLEQLDLTLGNHGRLHEPLVAFTDLAVESVLHALGRHLPEALVPQEK